MRDPPDETDETINERLTEIENEMCNSNKSDLKERLTENEI
jgi:hypothetical protein